MQSRFVARIAGSLTHAISFAYTSSHEGRTNFTVAVYCQLVGATPQRRSVHDSSSFEEAVALGDRLVANYHDLFRTEGYEVYCELIE